jgi:hypothetical protein
MPEAIRSVLRRESWQEFCLVLTCGSPQPIVHYRPMRALNSKATLGLSGAPVREASPNTSVESCSEGTSAAPTAVLDRHPT